MKSSYLYKDISDRDLPKMLIASVGFHVAIVCIFTLKVLLFPMEIPLYQASVRVDLVSLPDKQTATLPMPAAKAETTPPPSVAPTSQPETKKETKKIDLSKKQNKALEQLKALQELEAEVQNAKAEKKNAPIKGNVLAAGTSLKGLNKLDYDTYIGDVDSQIKSNWELPEWLAKMGLRARVLVLIDTRGYVIRKELILSSKNPTYDSLVMDTIDRSSPFPPPPEKFIDIVGVNGIVFQFPD